MNVTNYYREFLQKKRRALKQKDKAKLITAPVTPSPITRTCQLILRLPRPRPLLFFFGGVPHSYYFHFTQCLERRLLKFPKLNKRVRTNATLKTKQAFKSFQALALIPKERVNNTLDAFLATSYMQEHELIFRPFVQYFKRQWTEELKLERHGRKVKGKIS